MNLNFLSVYKTQPCSFFAKVIKSRFGWLKELLGSAGCRPVIDGANLEGGTLCRND